MVFQPAFMGLDAECPDPAQTGFGVGQDPNHPGATLDLLVQPLLSVNAGHASSHGGGQGSGDGRLRFGSRGSRGEDRPDLLLVTGDLAHRGSLEAYRRIARALAAFDVPWYVIPGNHDDPLHMRQGFGSELTPEVIHAGAWRILLLDSTLTGSPAGAIAPRALRRLDEAFAVYRDDPVLVALHHPPLATGTEWLDAIGLADAPGFRAHLTGRPGFRGTLFGHLHQAFEAHGESGLHLGCPSTAMQFVAGSPAPGIDPSRGGWRSLWLHPDGRLESRIHWVDFPPGA